MARVVHHSCADNLARVEIKRSVFEKSFNISILLLVYTDSKDLFAKQINANYMTLNIIKLI